MKHLGQMAFSVTMFALTIDIAPPAHAQDIANGKSVFRACAACHATDQTNRVGPGLQGIVGRTAGTFPAFRYSRAMRKSGIIWDENSLDAYLAAPQKAIPGNRMPFAGLKNANDRADLIAYLSTLK